MVELIASSDLIDEFRDALAKHPGVAEVLVYRRTLRNALAAVLEGRIRADELTASANLVELQSDEVFAKPASNNSSPRFSLSGDARNQ
ncbi:hypothetical protein [Bradyrhizobium australiense]|uniref:Uncharacterized protein n=1 Tax=Bradyrhizobium australiense TaxID=2721161 RepID=A0A7Y4GVW1_9BRAD|nr:hypothetical protein [Bradyrhizobium australiense]NOJ42861.1 hypothetical protein [Bradyrhizobium australiense]